MLIDKSICKDFTNEIIDFLYKQSKKKDNREKIKYISDLITSILLENVTPYLYTILAILILMFLTNCFTFYYYIKLFISSKNSYVNATDIFN